MWYILICQKFGAAGACLRYLDTGVGKYLGAAGACHAGVALVLLHVASLGHILVPEVLCFLGAGGALFSSVKTMFLVVFLVLVILCFLVSKLCFFRVFFSF